MMVFRLKMAFAFFWYYLYRPHRKGHGIHSPFLYAYLQEVVYSKDPDNLLLKDILALKTKLSKSKVVLCIEDMGVGSHTLNQSERSVSRISKISSMTHRYGRLLHRTVSYFKSETIVELGTCLGFGSMYMASASEKTKVITIEGSNALVKKSLENFHVLSIDRITVVLGHFDEAFPKVLKENQRFDVLFIDGNHKKMAVLNYLKQCLDYLTPQSIVILDDIRWSEDMLEAWHEICDSEQVTLSVDFFRMGMLFFNDKLKKQHFQIYY
jgi:predicted O-methyltransferase YrrM